MKNDLFNDRISRFSIRKLNVGVCSVLLGTLVMLGTATGVAAEEVVENKQTDEVAVTTEKEQPESLFLRLKLRKKMLQLIRQLQLSQLQLKLS